MEQTSQSDVYKFHFIATIEAYEDILNLDMTQFRKEMMDLFQIKSHKNLKQSKVEKHERQEYRITCSFCKKIKNDPNNYVNQLYAEIAEKKYVRAIQRGFDLSLRPDLLTLESKFKLIKKRRQSSNVKPKRRTRHNSHNIYSNGKEIKMIKPTNQNIEKRRNTYDTYDNDIHKKYKPVRKKKRKKNPNNNNNNNIYPTSSNKNHSKKPSHLHHKKTSSDEVTKSNGDNVYKKQSRRNTYTNRDTVQSTDQVKSNKKNNNNIYPDRDALKINHRKKTRNEKSNRSDMYHHRKKPKHRSPAAVNREKQYGEGDPNWSPPQPSGPPPTITLHGTVIYHDDIKQQEVVKPSVEVEMADLKSPNISYLKPPNNAMLKTKKSSAFVLIDSIRTKVTALHPSSNPAQGLLGLWIIIVVVVVCCLALISTIDGYIANIYIDLDTEGTFMWSLGWMNNMFFYLNDATCKACRYTSFDKIEELFPIPNTVQYMQNAGSLLTASVGVILLCIVCILKILCERRNSHEPLYIKINCLNIRIPQRPTVYFAWNIINLLTWACIVYYIMLLLYGYFETSFYLENACPSGLLCYVYVAPHYGLVALFCIVFPISCCALFCTRRLDPKFDDKTLLLYFPDHAEKAFEECQINLQQVFSCINVVKNIIVLAFIMTEFKEVGMINVVFYNETDSVGNTQSMTPKHVFYLQFQGLTNNDGITENSYLSVLQNSEMYGDFDKPFTNTSITTSYPTNLQDKASTMLIIASVWHWLVWIIMFINLLMVAPYVLYVILEYSSHKWIKLTIIGITFIQWFGHLILIVMYYYAYSVWFSNYAKSVLESELFYASDSLFDVYWFPDWGIFIAILLSFYLLKLMYDVSKAI